MKPILVLLGLVVAATAGAVGGVLVSVTNAPAPAETANASHADAAVHAPAAAPANFDRSELVQQVEGLTHDVASLRAELAALREGRVRAVPDEVAKKDGPDDTDSVFAAMHRGAILSVIADDRAEQQRKADEERRQRELEAATQRADRVAKELGLNKDQSRSLADVYVLEREKRDEFMKSMRDGAAPDREQMRQSFQEFRDWRTNELTTRLGGDLAAKVNDYEGDRFGFAGGRAFDGGGNGNDAPRARPGRRNGNGANGGNGNNGGASGG